MRALQLAAGVHLAFVDGDAVFLDAHHDSYVCVPRRFTAELQAALDREADVADLEALSGLVDAGLLVAARSDMEAWRGSPPDQAVADIGAGITDPADWRALAALGMAVPWTGHDLRRSRPAFWLERQRRRNGLASLAPPSHDIVVARAHQFARLRPLVPRSGRCLVRSLLLLNFLAHWRLPARWVFGVRTHPFEAHCWVEHDGVILNDTLEHCRWFTPITAV